MRIERENYLGAKPYERSADRQGHANGYKHKTVKTRVGEVTFDIPQVREESCTCPIHSVLGDFDSHGFLSLNSKQYGGFSSTSIK